MIPLLRTSPRAAALALALAVSVLAAGPSVSAETVALPAWVSEPGSPIVFPGGAPVDPAAAIPATLFGFAGTARGVSVSGGAVLVEAFELSPPEGARFVMPERPLPDYEPAPVFRSLELRADTRGPFAADCHYVRTPDPFGGVFEEGGAWLVWDGWLLVAMELELDPEGLLARNGYLVSGYDPENPEAPSPRGAASLAGRVLELGFDAAWNPVPGEDAIRAELYASLGGLGDVAVESLTLKREGGKLVAELESRPPAEDDWGLDEAPWSRALYGGDGILVSSTPRGGVAKFGWEGAFELEFEAETAGVPMTGSGLVRLPESLGGGEFRSAPGAVRAWAGRYWEGENYFEVSAFDEPVQVSYGGWELTSADASIGRVGDMKHVWALIAPSATLGWRGAAIPFENLAFSSEGWLAEAAEADGELDLPFFGDRFTASSWWFDGESVSARGRLRGPDELGGYSVFLDRVSLYPDGSWDAEPVSVFLMSPPVGELLFRNLYLAEDGLRAGSVEFTPSRAGAGTRIRMRSALLPDRGGFEAQAIDPFEIGGLSFWPLDDGLGMEDGKLAMVGRFHLGGSLPYGLPRDLAGTVAFPLDGSPPVVEAGFEAERALAHDSGYALRVSRGVLDISGDAVRLRLGGVRPAAGLEQLALDGVLVSAEGAWDFGAATLAEPVAFEREGVRYALSTLVLVDDERVLLSGRATRTAADGTVESHGCALSAGFDGSLTIVVAEGDELRYLR
ncbi:MAG TPA: hypothetical protein PKW82_01625 [Spirochaetales bacterium]|nr:hypothetical protein [Spirochaetales bacterium]